MDSYFAPPERLTEKELATEIEIVNKNAIVSGLLFSIGGLLAVLDEHRQILALNDSFLHMLGIDDPQEALGLRLGETLQCIHAHDKPAGCGTTKFCSTCGAAIATVACLEQGQPVEKICALAAKRGNIVKDVVLVVKSYPVKIDNKKFVILFLQDITLHEQRAALERTFFHDVNNLLTMLVGTSELLVQKDPSELANNLYKASLRLHKEIAIQRCLSQSDDVNYQPMIHEITTVQILSDIQSFFANHPVAAQKTIAVENKIPEISIKIDISLLSRILINMVLNALEATEENGVVKIWLEDKTDLLSFCVWNSMAIPQETAVRIFQRNFSTKGQAGRGIGTFSMKLFGENILGGQINFTTSKEKGTIFRFSYPY